MYMARKQKQPRQKQKQKQTQNVHQSVVINLEKPRRRRQARKPREPKRDDRPERHDSFPQVMQVPIYSPIPPSPFSSLATLEKIDQRLDQMSVLEKPKHVETPIKPPPIASLNTLEALDQRQDQMRILGEQPEPVKTISVDDMRRLRSEKFSEVPISRQIEHSLFKDIQTPTPPRREVPETELQNLYKPPPSFLPMDNPMLTPQTQKTRLTKAIYERPHTEESLKLNAFFGTPQLRELKSMIRSKAPRDASLPAPAPARGVGRPSQLQYTGTDEHLKRLRQLDTTGMTAREIKRVAEDNGVVYAPSTVGKTRVLQGIKTVLGTTI